MWRGLLSVIPVALLLLGCTPPSQVPYSLTTPFRAADFAPWSGPGDAILTGQAFLKTVGGEVRTCAGEDVALLPATAYNLEIVQTIREGHENLANRTGAADQFTRHATCDAQGNFGFVNVPPGRWIVWATVTWGVPDEDGIEQQGGRLIREVVLQPGGNAVLLSEADFLG